MYNINSFSEFGTLIVIAVIIFGVIIPFVVLFSFLSMTADVKRIRTMLESWHADGLPPTISPVADDVITEKEIELK
jgi:hypothetical protein